MGRHWSAIGRFAATGDSSVLSPFAGKRVGGVGLEMIERRLALAYDGRATFRIVASGTHTIAEVVFPVGAVPREERA